MTGTDAASFELDKNGNLTSKVIMNFEEKPQFNLNLVYTKVIMYTLRQSFLMFRIILRMMVTTSRMLILAHKPGHNLP